MKQTLYELKDFPQNMLGQLKYSIFFIDHNIMDVEISDLGVKITHNSQKSDEEIQKQVDLLVSRFSSEEFVFEEKRIFENRVKVPYNSNIMEILLDKKIIKLLEPGIFTFREPFTKLLKFLDDTFTRNIGYALGASEEYYPATIHGHTLNKVSHFTSFPEHLLFISHLKEDLDILDEFSKEVKKSGGWSEELSFDYTNKMTTPSHMMNPATCYHCYEGMQGEQLDSDGIVVTAVSKVYRYESKNHRDFGRLMDFTLREVIFVGKPDFVREKRGQALEILKKMVSDWELDCWIENANDPFFTNDFQVKASYQRKQEMKFELRMQIPYLDKSIAVFSTNFHGNVFANAFDIKAGKRPAVTGCIGFGLERWVLAFLAQYGLDETCWPQSFREDFRKWQELNK